MDAETVIRRCLTLARYTEEPGHITRTFLTPPMREVHREVRRWMEEAGMRVTVDAVGNIHGVSGSGPRLMVGSHLDTVPHAGAFDGILGVMIGIALAAERQPVSMEVVGFSEEEGVRFGVPFIGSRALVGDPVMDDGVIEAIREYGFDPAEIPMAAISRDVQAYLEFHIEQGPVLERAGLFLGVVDGIVGQSRAEVEFRGRAGHAGTTPMDARNDALAAAAEWIGMVERTAIEEGVVATVGRLEVGPGAVNVIPGRARASLDVRHQDAKRIEYATGLLRAGAQEIAGRRGVGCQWEVRSNQCPVEMDRELTSVLSGAVEAAGYPVFPLSSGAGHDAMILARRVPAAMLFLRSPGGLSHHPDETVTADVVEAALAAGEAVLERLEAPVIVRGGKLVTPEGVVTADLAMEDGRIAAIAPELPGGAEEIDARGLTVFPGLIDVHVHFNEPGRTDWEGGKTGSSALAAGGGTLFFDMPLNSSPCTVGGREFRVKRDALARSSVTDFALWGGIVPGNRDALAELAECGVIGFKAFMADSGLPEFPRSDDRTLYEGMREAARLNLPVAVHAENNDLVRPRGAGTGVRDFLESRPVLAEVEAIQRAALLAGETGVKLHIVHVSSGRGVAAALEAKARGVDLSIETCPHYLWFTEEDMLRIGAVAKCAPPLRSAAERRELWAAVVRGDVDIVGSDHSPAPGEMKRDENFFRVWGGIAGIQSTLPVLLSGASPERIAALTAGNPARRFGIANKGRLAVGCDADLALVDLAAERTVTRESLFQRHGLSPYVGCTFRGEVRRTILRGETIFQDGRILREGGGRMIEHAATRIHA